MHYSLLSGVRTALVEADMAAIRVQPVAGSAVTARAEAGAIVRVGRCELDWCRVVGGRQRGWMAKADLWGVDPKELRD